MSQEQNQTQKNQEQDVNQLLKVRREKLAALQAAGKDPFQITKYDQTHHTSDDIQRMQQDFSQEEKLQA